MKFSLRSMPITIYLEFRDGEVGDEAITEMDDNTATIVLHSTDNIEETILHEVIHAVSHQLRRIGIEHLETTEEIYAYTIGYFYKVILKRVKVYIEKTRKELNK